MCAVKPRLIPALGDPTARLLTERGRAFESVMENLTGGPRPFRHEGLLDRFAGNFSVTFDDLGRRTLAARAATNQGITYRIAPGYGISDGQLNDGVYRLAA